MGEDKRESESSEVVRERSTPERPPVDLHDPFSRFDFEPTDGGDF